MAEEFAERLKQIEQKWQERWDEKNLFEADPREDDEDNFYITVAYPYPSGGMHIGHIRTYTLPDVFGRFKRMQGKNVLFPMAWHVTGTPIVGALDRVKRGDEHQISTLRDTYKVPEDVLNSMEEPMDYADYFIEESYKPNMKKLGFGVDWRREFTTNDKHYNRFIEWQYKRLQEKGYLQKGMHPTKYCTVEENPVTTHDLSEGEAAEKQDYSLVKFEKDGKIFPMATLRPETVFGVTHTLINPEADYVEADAEGEKWIVSKEAADKLEYQDRDVEVQREMKGEEFVGEEVRNPVTGDEVMILPATFVDPDSGSGVVMSVPAHAPYDWISLKDIQENDELIEKYNLDAEKVKAIEPKTIIDVEDYGEIPAKEACEEYGVESQEDEEELEEATEEIYEKEFHTGTLNSNCQDFAGEKVNAVKDRLIERFENQGRFDSMYDFSEEVICRCGGDVVVSMQESWFLEYDNPEWQDQVEKCLDQTDLIPEDTREEFEHTIDWLESWPCIRNFGLGTKMPFDQDFVVEPLSDSTIYMAFYTISHLVQEKDSDKLEPEFFDYVFNGKGTAEEVADFTGLDEDFVEECRESFDYWYPMDWRTTAYPLIQNHLTFMLYHHAALFDEPDWPEGIASWGLVTLEGEKMSSSKGNVALPDEEIEKHGADTVRFFLFAKLEPWEDFDWTAEGIREYKNKLQAFYNRTLTSYNSGKEREKNKLDRYALSRLQEIIKKSTEGLEEFQTRKSGLKGFYELNSLINKYRNRAETVNTEVINELVETQLKLMTPYIPHTCEELWSEIGKEGMISEEEWPKVEEEKIDEEVENAYELLEETVSDIREVAEIVGEYNRIKVITAAEWKRELFKEMEEVIEERPEFGEAMGRLVEGREEHADQIKNFLQSYFDEPGDMPPEILSQGEETEALEENRDFIEREFEAEVEIESEEDSEEEKASRAEPGKPAIVME